MQELISAKFALDNLFLKPNTEFGRWNVASRNTVFGFKNNVSKANFAEINSYI